MRKKLTLVASLAFAAALCAGVGAANVQADAAANYSDFAITATAVRVADPSGLRFKVDCPTTEVENAYTVLTMTTAAGVSKTAEVPATVWRKDNTGWNTVLLGIPDTDYVTEVTAQAFVTIKGVEYETGTVTSSIAKTASSALNAGLATEAQVGQYVAGKVQSITLDKATLALRNGATAQLSATVAPVDYAVVWSTSDASIVTVDKNGNVTAVGIGEATITASMGGVSATCEVTVEQYFDGSFETYASLAEFTHEVYVGTTKAISFAQSPTDASNQTLKVEMNDGQANVRIYLSDAFIANAEAGNVLTWSAWAVKGDNTKWAKAFMNIGDGSEKMVAGGNVTQSASWLKVDYVLTEADVATIKADKNIRLVIKVYDSNGNQGTAGAVNATYYFDEIAISSRNAFDGTFETLTTGAFSYSAEGNPVVSIAQNPTNANGKALKVETNTGRVKLVVGLSDAMLAQAEVGKVLTWKAWAIKTKPDATKWAKMMHTTFGNTSEYMIAGGTVTESAAWYEYNYTLTANDVTTLQSGKTLTFMLLTFNMNGDRGSDGQVAATYYIDDIAIVGPDRNAFDGTFESMVTPQFSYAQEGSPTIAITQGPKAENGKALKLDTNTGRVKLTVNLSDAFVAQAAAGKTLVWKAWAKKTNSATKWAKVMHTTFGNTSEYMIAGGNVTESADWYQYSYTLTANDVATLQSGKALTFIILTYDMDGNRGDTGEVAATYYFDDIAIK